MAVHVRDSAKRGVSFLRYKRWGAGQLRRRIREVTDFATRKTTGKGTRVRTGRITLQKQGGGAQTQERKSDNS